VVPVHPYAWHNQRSPHEPVVDFTTAGPGPYLPKPEALYQALETGVRPKRTNMLTSPDDGYWKAVRQAAAPCFSMSNMKQVPVGSNSVDCF
jgi:hypothetical protein